MTSSRLLPLAAALAAALTFAAPTRAQSLVELYESALAWDASFQSARLQYDANVARAEQARAGLLPTAGLSAGYTRSSFDNSNALIPDRRYPTGSATLSASQPLYRPANRATYEQGLRQIELSRAQLDAAGQDLILRVSQAYFDVLAAQDTLTFVRAQKSAVGEQLASAKRNFEVGTTTVTDSREAQARFDLVTAQEISADNDLRVKKLALDQLVGKPGSDPRPLVAPAALPALDVQDVDAWVRQSQENHPGVRQNLVAVDIARLETEKARAGHKPTVDAIASYSANRSPDGTASSALNNRSGLATVGVQMNLPLFAGFSVQNRIRETLALEDKAASDLEATRRTVAQGTRAAYFGVNSGLGQVKALEAAELSTQSALDANKLGYQVGVRINIDVLNSQSQLYQTKRDLAQARYNVLLGTLRLRQASGSLTPNDLLPINALLAR